MNELPPESEKLLAATPSTFVAERERLARELLEAGRTAESAAVAGMRKPSAVVLAVNRAARDRPNAARGAAEAAAQVGTAQAAGDLDAFKDAVGKLDQALDLLSEVAVAHVGPGGKKPTDAMRRRVHDLLRRAAANAQTREALSRGTLVEEQEAVGFASLPETPTTAKGRKGAPRADTRAKRQDEERSKRAKALRRELADAEEALREAEKAVSAAERERAKAERAVASIQAKLDRLP